MNAEVVCTYDVSVDLTDKSNLRIEFFLTLLGLSSSPNQTNKKYFSVFMPHANLHAACHQNMLQKSKKGQIYK
jgi:hypothetical protein